MKFVTSRMNTITNPFNIYLLLWMLHYLVGIVVMPGTVLSALISLLLLLYTAYYSLKAIRSVRFPRCLNTLFVFGCVLIIYGVFLVFTGETIGTNVSDWTFNGVKFCRQMLSSIFPVFVLYYFCCLGFVSEKTIKIWAIIMMCVVTAYYFQKRVNMIEVMNNYAIQRDGFTNNASYTIAAFLPLIIYLSKNRITQMIAFCFCLYMIVLGVKRGAILISFLIFFFYVYTSFKNMDKMGRTVFLILLMVIGYFSVMLFQEYFAIDAYFMSRLESTREGDLNGRDEIFARLLNIYCCEYNIIELFIGRGAYGTLKSIGQFAHNDWIEILLSHGFMGLALYVVFYIRFYKFVKSHRRKTKAWYSLVMVFIALFVKTLFSMSYNEIDIWLSLALSYNIFILNTQHENISCNTQLSH